MTATDARPPYRFAHRIRVGFEHEQLRAHVLGELAEQFVAGVGIMPMRFGLVPDPQSALGKQRDIVGQTRRASEVLRS